MKFSVTQPRVLAKVPSKTNPTRSYEIRLGGDGVVYCTCRAWITNKFCKHLEEYHAGNQVVALAKTQNIKLSDLGIKDLNGKPVDAMLKFFEETAKAAGVGMVDNRDYRDYITRIVQDGIIGGKWT